MSSTALVLGATGLVGQSLLAQLLADARYDAVRVLARRPLPLQDPRLVVRTLDFDALEAEVATFEVDHVFCCLGTTLKRAGSREAFQRVDYDYVLTAARLAAAAGAGHFLWVSALGATPRARVFYSRVKGELEEAIAGLPLRRWTAVRPSLLLGPRTEHRPGEAAAIALTRPLHWLLAGPLRVYRPIPAATVAAAMIALAQGEAAPPGLQLRSGGAG